MEGSCTQRWIIWCTPNRSIEGIWLPLTWTSVGKVTCLWLQYFCVNPFSTNVSLLHPLKTLENLEFSDVFKGYRSGTLIENGLWLIPSYLTNTEQRTKDTPFTVLGKNFSSEFHKDYYLIFLKKIFIIKDRLCQLCRWQ